MRWLPIVVMLVASDAVSSQNLRANAEHFGARNGETRKQSLPSLLLTAGDKPTEADGTLSWQFLTRISVVKHENTDGRFGRGIAYFAEPVVAPEIRVMVGRKVKVKGYALPRSAGAGFARILVSALPAVDLDGCTAGGTETFVDVVFNDASMPTVDTIVVVEGTLTLFDMQNWGGYIYKLLEPRIISGT